MEIPKEQRQYLEEEWYHVRHSGEIPEIAYHSSIHFLTEDRDGPGIVLTRAGLVYLQEAARERYIEIILRDITPEHRDTAMYRGVLRSISNWRRFKRFCERNGMDAFSSGEIIASRFLHFLENEVRDVSSGERESCINCGYEDILSIAVELDFDVRHLGERLEKLCLRI